MIVYHIRVNFLGTLFSVFLCYYAEFLFCIPLIRILSKDIHDIFSFLQMQPPENWNGGVGFVSKEMIQSHCPAPADDIQVILSLGVFFPSRFTTGLIAWVECFW